MFIPMWLCFSPCAYDSSETKSLPVVIRERDVEYQVSVLCLEILLRLFDIFF